MSEESFSHQWKTYCRENPALTGGGIDQPMGWVMEHDNRIVGFFGSIPRLYRCGDRDIRVSVASTWAVEKNFRTHTNLLCTAYFSQTDVDLLMVTTAIKPTSRIFSRFSGRQMPLPDYDKVLFWIIEPVGFLNSVLLKQKLRKNTARLLSYVLSPLLFAMITLKIKSCYPTYGKKEVGIEKKSIRDIGSEFDDLWQRKVKEKTCLYAYRTSEYLCWSLELCGKSNQVSLFCGYRENRLDGYIVLSKENVSDISLERCKIIDLFVADDDRDVIDALLAAAFHEAREQGCHILELVGYTENIRAQILKYRPLSRRYINYPYYYKALSRDFESLLLKPEFWYPSPYDGDSAF